MNTLPSLPERHALPLFIGLMSGTSLDGVDGVLAAFDDTSGQLRIQTIATAYLPFDDALQAELLALQSPGENEIEREARAGNALAVCYARCIADLLEQSGTSRQQICAVGAHGQTIRHRPELGFTRQTNNPALLAELTGIDVIADFRARDIAAGGQGAPLVPAFHQEAFGSTTEMRVIVNIGGIANITVLPRQTDRSGATGLIGFDTGPGNVLMDHWVRTHLGKPYDDSGTWAASGTVLQPLLDRFLLEPFFGLTPPKSTGRDLFHPEWLDKHLTSGESTSGERSAPANVQATLAMLTAATIADAIESHANGADTIYLCGGGARNLNLVELIRENLQRKGQRGAVLTTDALGVAPSHVEPLAFAWLAKRFVSGQPGNLASVTGAEGLRRLGALYPAI